MNWYPHLSVRRASDITLSQLEQWGIEGLILDIDNTLTTHDNPIPSQGIADWLAMMRDNGIQMMVLSNNTPQRVEPFANILGLEFIADGKKPLRGGYLRCAQAMGLPPARLCMVGDQLFTDIWGGRRAGCRTILVEPIQLEEKPFFRFKRFWERQLLKKHSRHAGEQGGDGR